MERKPISLVNVNLRNSNCSYVAYNTSTARYYEIRLIMDTLSMKRVTGDKEPFYALNGSPGSTAMLEDAKLFEPFSLDHQLLTDWLRKLESLMGTSPKVLINISGTTEGRRTYKGLNLLNSEVDHLKGKEFMVAARDSLVTSYPKDTIFALTVASPTLITKMHELNALDLNRSVGSVMVLVPVRDRNYLVSLPKIKAGFLRVSKTGSENEASVTMFDNRGGTIVGYNKETALAVKETDKEYIMFQYSCIRLNKVNGRREFFGFKLINFVETPPEPLLMINS